MRLHAEWLRFLVGALVVVVVLLGGRDALACDTDYDCDVDYTCCGDGYCYYLSCPSFGCSSDYDCASDEGCCSDGTCDTACLGGGSTESCLSSEVDCNDGWCCDSAHPFCCGDGTCAALPDCSTTIGGSGSGSTGVNGGPAPKQWGCAMTSAPNETPWGTLASAALALVVVIRARKRGRR